MLKGVPAFVRLLFDSRGPTIHRAVLDLKIRLHPFRSRCQPQASINENHAKINSQKYRQTAGKSYSTDPGMRGKPSIALGFLLSYYDMRSPVTGNIDAHDPISF